MKKVGLLGGTFNPPHIGHLIIANEVKHALGLDEVRLMPTSIPPHKSNPTDATPEQRLRMVDLAVEGTNGLSVSAFEVEQGGVSYTFETMKRLKEHEPGSDFYFIIGGDMIDILPNWYKIEELVKVVKFVGVGRPGTIGKSDFPIRMVQIPEIELSSTLIRERIGSNGTIRFLVPEKVENFIRLEGLYGNPTNN
ncbi:nicotinate-nucleotide adenylyltransferase [Sporosarcina thermotolerans]|uniref:Probable nicotinate-nucleotide adenylyltransferase n=1 Tax=Sporosarcina thermotolerans TaxID=633404 RepID=A0AAW9A8N8_9BACL|nr:nicotinate-nucleotide adenylyltransferase [Sporosarcina thermotolerans]MDW0117414.1 nicotinate-nucleotide adenylyltransferase [Sporosarcina thermotolerans]WHT47551.1 nicotinate-nucleotide adenylyltransferase [Sporosarcina thermotolerans]